MIEGESTAVDYTTTTWNPNVIWLTIVCPAGKVIIAQLNGGGKVAIPIVTPTTGDKCIVLRLRDGNKVVTKLPVISAGDKVVTLLLPGGGKVAVPISTFVATGSIYQADTGDADESTFRQFKCYIKTTGSDYKLRFTLTFNDNAVVTKLYSQSLSSYTLKTIDYPGSSGLKSLRIECQAGTSEVYIDDMSINHNGEFDYTYADWNFEDPSNSEFVFTGNAERSTTDPRNGTRHGRLY